MLRYTAGSPSSVVGPKRTPPPFDAFVIVGNWLMFVTALPYIFSGYEATLAAWSASLGASTPHCVPTNENALANGVAELDEPLEVVEVVAAEVVAVVLATVVLDAVEVGVVVAAVVVVDGVVVVAVVLVDVLVAAGVVVVVVAGVVVAEVLLELDEVELD